MLQLEPLEDRRLLNNRSVVPAFIPSDNVDTFPTLAAALTTAGLNSGDIIQIEPGSSPGSISNADIPAVTNLTIQGNRAFFAAEIPTFQTSDAVTISQSGLTLNNVNMSLVGGNLIVDAPSFSILGSIVTNFFSISGTAGVLQLQSTDTRIEFSELTSHAGATATDFIQIRPTENSGNTILANSIYSSVTQDLVSIGFGGTSGATLNDQFLFNRFLGNIGTSSSEHMDLFGTWDTLTIRGNTFTDTDASQIAITQGTGVSELIIDKNVFDLTGAGNNRAITIFAGSSGTTGSTITGNSFDTAGQGTGIQISGPSTGGTLTLKVEANDFHFNNAGVRIFGSTGSLDSVDLGGGTQGSLGGNNFRGFRTPATSSSGAIVNGGNAAQGPVSAQGNLFGVANPEDVIFDQADDAARSDVDASNNLTGNSAFVQSLYVQFLKRAADLADPNNGAGFVTILDGGAPRSDVVNLIAKSSEALGMTVDGYYRSFLFRLADTPGKNFWVGLIQAGNSLESTIRSFVTSPEYTTKFNSDADFIISLYYNLFGRRPENSEVAFWLVQVPNIGRSGMADAFLGSPEYRGNQVRFFYDTILNRSNPPSQPEVDAWVNSGLDLLTVQSIFTGTDEFFANG